MNRLLLALNLLFLAGFLGTALYKPIRAWALAGRLSASEVRIESPSRQAVARLDGFCVRFGAPMAAPEQLGERIEPSPLTLEPPAAVACRWASKDLLEVRPMERLPGARVYRVRLDPGLRALDGRRLPGDLCLEHRTRLLGLEPPMLVDLPAVQEQEGWQGLKLLFDQAVEVGELEQHLQVAGPTGPLEWRIEPLEESEARGFLLVARGKENGERSHPRAVEVTVLPGLKPLGAELPLEGPIRHSVSLVDALLVQRATAGHGTIDLHFNREVGLPEAGLVTLTPAIPFQAVRNWSAIRLEGEFPPGTVVRIGLAKEFPGKGRNRLPRGLELSVRIPDLEPAVRIAAAGEVLSSLAVPELEFEAVNAAGFKARARTLYPNNIVSLAHAGRWELPDHVFGPWRELELGLAGPENMPFFGQLDLAALVPGDVRGIHQVSLGALDARGASIGDSDSRLLQVTDLGVALRVSPGNALVRVASLATGLPVEGASVRLLTPSNQELGAGRTGPDGVIVLACGPAGGGREPFVAEVRHGLDRTFVDLGRFGVELAEDDLSGRPFLREGAEAWVHFDRGVVRPGEQARAVVAVRDHRGRPPAGKELRLTWIGPGRRTLKKETVRVPASGLFVAELETGLASPSGPLRLELSAEEALLGQGVCRLECFVPDRMEAFLEAAGPLLLGGEARVRVRGRWLDGSPAAGRSGRLSVRFDRGRFAPQGWQDYSFADLEGAPPPGARPVEEFALDEQGEALLRFALPVDSGSSQVLLARMDLELLDPSGRPVRAGLEQPVHRPDHYLGLRIREGGCDLVLVDAGGNLVQQELAAEVALEIRSWRWVARAQAGAGRFQSELVRERAAAWPVALAAGRGRLELPASSLEGWRVLSVRAGALVAAVQTGGTSVRPERLGLKGPDGRVRPGEAAVLALEAPFAGTALVTLEGLGIHGSLSFQVPRGRSTLQIPLPADLDQPNVYAVVTLSRPQAVGEGDGPCWAVGAVSIPLALEGRRLELVLEAPAEVEPGGRVRIRVAAPGAASAVVGLVDEGVRRLTGHPDPDPAAWFLARRRLDSRGADTGRKLIGNPRFEPLALPGGDGEFYDKLSGSVLEARLAGSASALIQPVVLLSGPLALDEQGVGFAEFSLPEYEGRLRAFAVASGTAGVGGAATDVVVRGALGLLAAAPRILRPGDESRAILVVRNGTGSAGELRLQAAALGGALLAAEAPRARLEAGEQRTLALRFVAGPTPGEQGFEVRAVLNGAERRLRVLTSVQPLAHYTVERIGLAVEGRRSIALPGEWIPGTLAVRLSVDGDPMASLRPTLESLMGYPYGCAEQTLSRLFGLLACRSLLSRMAAEGEAPDPTCMLQVGMERLFAMRTQSGGLSAWPGGGWVYPLGTLYGLDFLLSAREQSLAVDEELLSGLIGCVEEMLRENRDLSLRCYAAELLARAGRPVASWLELLESGCRLREDRARLALAWARIGRRGEALRLLQGAELGSDTVRRERGGFLRTETRAQAIELRAWLAAAQASDRVAELADLLAGRLSRPGGLTTQEQGQGLIALAAFYHTAGGEAGQTACTIATPRSVRRVDRPCALALDLQAGETLAIDAPGRIFATLELNGLRAGLDDATRGGVSIERRFFDLESGQQVLEFRAGRVYEVRLAVEAREGLENLCVTDLLPGGFEPEGGREHVSFRRPPWPMKRETLFDLPAMHSIRPDQLEPRDDRVLAFLDASPGPAFLMVHRVRAVFPGTYTLPPASVEALYEPAMGARAGGGGKVVILP